MEKLGYGREGVRGVRIWGREAVMVPRRVTGKSSWDGDQQMSERDAREADM